MCVTHSTHDDSAINSQLQVVESAAHYTDDTLHVIYFLSEEDVHGSNGPHLLKPCLHFMLDVVCWELIQHLLCMPVHYALPGLLSTTGTIFRLDGEDGVQTCICRIALIPVGRV